jgi:hypothetical protein
VTRFGQDTFLPVSIETTPKKGKGEIIV